MSFSMGLPPVFLIFAIASRVYFNTGLFFVHSCKLLSTRSASGFRLHKKRGPIRSIRPPLYIIVLFAFYRTELLCATHDSVQHTENRFNQASVECREQQPRNTAQR